MSQSLNQEEVAILIRARQVLKAKGFAKDADVKTICEAAGISRKTGYSWANKFINPSDGKAESLSQELARIKIEHEELKKHHERLEIENEGRKLAWEIHGINELLAAKKNTTRKHKRRKP